MEYLHIKSLHIIFVVTWFAGLFYMVRLLIYHTEAQQRDEPEKSILTKEYLKNEKPLWYGITWPSAILTFIFGFWLVYILNAWTTAWMLLKFSFVFGLFVYHLSVGSLYSQVKKGNFRYSSTKLRIWNEVATVFLVAIVFVIVLKDTLSWVWGLIGMVIFSMILLIAIKVYKKVRERKR